MRKDESLTNVRRSVILMVAVENRAGNIVDSDSALCGSRNGRAKTIRRDNSNYHQTIRILRVYMILNCLTSAFYRNMRALYIQSMPSR